MDCSKLVLSGDFIASSIDWNLLTSTGRDRIICDSLIKMSQAFDLSQLVHQATREDSVLDLVFANGKLVKNGYLCRVFDGISVYKAVIVDLNVARKPVRPTFKTVLHCECADYTSIFAQLASCLDDFVSCSDHCSVDTLTNQFYRIVNKCIAQFVAQKSTKRHAKHRWYTRSITHLKCRIQRMQKRRSTHNNDGEYQINLLKAN